jgi:nucleoid DNA-binding protein
MIEEIPNPLPSIFDIIDQKRLENRIKRNTKTKLGLYDVAFNTDNSLVEEFSKECNIDYTKALSFLTVFFEEIKKEVMQGNIVKLYNFGKFYVNGPHRGCTGKVVMPKAFNMPRFKLSVNIKRKISNK